MSGFYLTATTDTIKVNTASGADIDVSVQYDELTLSGGAILNDRQLTAITTATDTTILSAPASGKTRRCGEIHIYNKDVSSQTVIIYHDANGTQYKIDATLIDPGEHLYYTAGVGFYKKTSANKLDKMLFVASDVTNATTSFADITGLTWSVDANKKYTFNAWLLHRTDATTTGAQFGVNGPTSGNTVIGAHQQIVASATTAATGGAGTAAAYDTAPVVETTGPGATSMIALIQGAIETTAAGTFAMRSKSEVAVAGGLVIKRGSWCHLREADNQK